MFPSNKSIILFFKAPSTYLHSIFYNFFVNEYQFLSVYQIAMSTSKLCTVQVKSHNCLEAKPIEPQKVKKKKTVQLDKGSVWEALGKQTVQYYDGDGLKVMILPSKETNYYPLTITNAELERLKAKAIVLSEKERLKILEDAKAQQAQLEHESAVRKNELKQAFKKAELMGKGRLSALEREARERANYLLKRSWELRKEEDDEVKHANSLILQTKCQAIRDAQLIEHKLIQKEMREEEIRLDRMMEDERGRLFGEERKRLEEERAKKARYVRELNQQLDEIKANRLLLAEQMMEERRKTTEAMFVVMLEELDELHKREEEKRKTREALNTANEQIIQIQAIEREEERIADLRMKEYIRMRVEREEKLEKEKEAERKRKDMEYARHKSLQQKQADLQNLQDEMNAVRRQEEYEREWRRKEMEAAKKRQKLEEDCKLGREQQIRDNRIYQAMELAREKVEFERNLKVQLEIQERERLMEVKKKYEKEGYRAQILKQINQKEKERIRERQERFKEGLGYKAEEAKKRCELKVIFDKKIEILRQHNVPEAYISEIQRRLNL